jgi:hypothetical protein
MELTMGTPISTIARQAIENFCLEGIVPESDTLHALGIDVKLLEQSYGAIKEKLSQLEGYQTLEAACAGRYVREYVKTWDVLVEEAGLTGTRVLRFLEERDSIWPWPLFSHHAYGDVEVFLTRNGDWIIWDGGDSDRRPHSFVRRRTVRTMLKALDPLLKPRRWDSDYPALLLRSNLKRFVTVSIAAKKSRLAPLESLDEFLSGTDDRNNLNT